MSSFNFDTGLKTFDINGDPEREFSFCPSDPEFVRSILEVAGDLEELQQAHGELDACLSSKEMKGPNVEFDREIRSAIDSLFDEPISEKIFGRFSSFRFVDGAPFWATFLITLLAECADLIVGQTAEINPRFAKLMDKYKK